MGAVIDIVIEGIKKFGGEIIGGILLAVALWLFPGLRKLLSKYEEQKRGENESEIQKQLNILQQEERHLTELQEVLKRHDEALRMVEAQTSEEIQHRADIKRQLEEQSKEEERVRAEIQRQQEALRQEEARKAEEARRKAEIERRLEENRREEERVKAEIQRKQKALEQAEARKAEEALRRKEMQKQLETRQNSQEENISDSKHSKRSMYVCIAILIFAVCLFREREPTDARTQYELGKKFYDAMNYEKALYWYNKAAEQGDVHAQMTLAIMYSNGKGVNKNSSYAAKWYFKAAQHDEVWAVYEMGRLADKSMPGSDFSLPLDERRTASKWYARATELGHEAAKSRRRHMYNDDGTPNIWSPVELKSKVKFLQECAGKGKAFAQCELGDMHYYGDGVPKDFAKAVELYREAAKQEMHDAQYMLGHMYYYGDGVEQDKIVAADWYLKAAESSWECSVWSQCELGHMYYYGDGVTQDYAEAFKWYRKAAEKGNAAAQYELGFMYECGYAVSQDKAEALKWYDKASWWDRGRRSYGLASAARKRLK